MARVHRIPSLTTLALVSSVPVRVRAFHLGNASINFAAVQFFNTAATANVNLGVTVPDAEYGVQQGQNLPVFFFEKPLEFSQGLVMLAGNTWGSGINIGAGLEVVLALES